MADVKKRVRECMMKTSAVITLKNVSKFFGHVVANDKISMEIRKGEILSLLGENGSGKTTLMNMLAGIYFPDEGHIFVNGTEVTIRSPKDAYRLGIGMIHQHFKLIDVFSAAENIVLGLDQPLDIKKAAVNINELTQKYGFQLDPYKKVYDMSISEKQTVEIIKVLYRNADVLILDEPTAVLTPQEARQLFCVLRNMKADGKAVIIITHKLHEVMEISDRVAVMRQGAYVGDVKTSETNPQMLINMMMGEAAILNIERPIPKNTEKRLSVENLTVINADGIKVLDHVSFEAYGGEILGIAGISGCGQKELLESVAGLQAVTEGSIQYLSPGSDTPKELVGSSPEAIKKMGIVFAFVPEDRLGMGLVGNMDIADNMMLKSYREGHNLFVDRKVPKKLAMDIIKQLHVVTPGISTPVRRLSGGNVQKILVGREISSNPTILMTAYAVRGLDVNTSYAIYDLLNAQKKNGVAVIYVGEDLDVLLELCDRIMVLCGGKVNGIVDGHTATKEEVGMLMTHLKEEVGKE
jgi:ABC-type uncharacterized transport system ATPase subunit